MIEIFDAGSAVFTLTGHVVRSGFEQYGRLVEQARAQKEHSVILGAETRSGGFEKFVLGINTAQRKTEEFAVKSKGTLDTVSASVDKFGTATNRGLSLVGEALSRTGQKFILLGDAAKNSARVVEESEAKVVEATRAVKDEVASSTSKIVGEQDAQARAYKTAADEKIRANERVIESDRVAARGPSGPGPPGRGGGGGPGATPEEQANRASGAWKAGFTNLANMGKWATLGLLGVGAISVKVAADFQRNMELLHTQANYTQEDVEKLRKRLLALAPAVGVGPNELAKSLYHVASAGIDANHALEVVKYGAEAAKVGMANAEDVTNALVAVWKSAPKDVHSVSETVGVLNDIVGQGNLRWEDLSKALTTGVVAAAKNAHLGLRDLGAALDVMTSRGIPAEQAATRLRTTLTLMSSPTGKASAALSQLGLSQSQLAQDMQQHGLSYALQDLQKHLDATFPPGRKLTLEEERKALTDYGNSLYSAGERGKKLENDIAKFKHQLDSSGDSAIKQSQLITQAFGGSRMGTTMALLMQNADDVRAHFENLNKANAAGRFQQAWQATEKDFSVRAAKIWAGIQKVTIQIGDYLIPKVEKMVEALTASWTWLTKHKVILDTLAVLFGTLLVAAITAFFVRMVAGAVKSTIEIGKFAASIRKLPEEFGKATQKSIEWLGKMWAALRRNREEVQATGDAAVTSEVSGGAPGGGAGGGAASRGGEGGVAEVLGGAIEGMITGVHGTMGPGSIENPLAVVVMAADRYGLGAQGAASAAQTPTEAASSTKQAEAQASTSGSQPTKAATAETAVGTSAAQEAQIARLEAQKEFERTFQQQYKVSPGNLAGGLPPNASREVQASYAKLQRAVNAAAEEIQVGGQAVASDLKAGGAKSSSILEGGAQAAAAEERAGGAALAGELEAAGAKAAAEIDAGAAAAATEEVAGGAGAVRGGGVVGGAGGAAERGAIAAEGEASALGGGVSGFAGKAGSVASKALGAAGIAGIGVMGSQLLGGLIGGKAGSDVSTIGSTASVGAALGSFVGPWGTAIGGALGAAAGIAIKVFGLGKSYGKDIADHLTKGFGGAAADNLKSQVSKSLDDYHKYAQQQADHQKPVTVGRFGITGRPPPALTKDQIAKMAADAQRAGTLVAQQLEAGWSQYKFQDEPTMFKQLRAEIKTLPPQAQAYAIQSAVVFAQGLEKNGKLAKGGAEQLLKQVRSAFPGFEKYVGLASYDSAATFAKNMKLSQAQTNVKNAMANIRGDFPTVVEAMDRAKGGIQEKSAAAVKALRDIVNHGTGPMKVAAKADLDALRHATEQDMQATSDVVSARMATIVSAIKAGSSDAALKAGQNFNAFVSAIKADMQAGTLTVKQGLKLINDATVQELQQLGVDSGTAKKLANQGWSVGQVSQAISSAASVGAGTVKTSEGQTITIAQSGGRLPGQEFGRSDMMTLIDPLGRPRAKMAGDEGVFTQHQMPYVDMGLRMLGINGAEGLWNSVTAPHGINVGYSYGGRLSLDRLYRGGPIGGKSSPSAGPPTGQYIYPLPSDARVSRTDMGVDANMAPGEAIGPIGDARIAGIQQGWFQGQPFIWWQLLNGPRAGQYAYVAEQITGLARPGQIVAANQPVASYASSGTGIEYGWATASGRTLAAATTGYREGQITPAGQDMRAFLTGLSHGKILGGGAVGSVQSWTPLQPPHVKGTGVTPASAQKILDTATAAVNQYGQKQVGYLSGFKGGGDNQQNQALGKKMMLAMGWGADQWPALQALWTQESNWSSTALNKSSGAYGIPQSLPADKMASAGADWRSNPATQIAWGLRYIKDTYKTPQGAEGHEKQFNWYNRGGRLLGFQHGGRLRPRAARSSPWAPLPGAVGRLPGFRPPRVRRGAGGLHVVGGSRTPGSRRGGSGAGGGGRGGAGHQQARGHQTISQTTANTLNALGFGNFVDDQNQLGKLDSRYDQESNLFQLFDSGGAGLPLEDLNVLMGIREQQWDILFKEWKTLPQAIAAVQNDVNALMGKVVPGHRQHPRQDIHLGQAGGLFGSVPTAHIPAHGKWIPSHTEGGVVPALTSEVTHTEDQIKGLRHDLQLDSQKMAGIRHSVSSQVQNIADGYASAISAYINDIALIQDQKYSNSQQRQIYQSQLRNLPSSKGSGTAGLSVSDIVSGVMSGALPSTGAAGSNPAKKGLQDKIAGLHHSDTILSQGERQLRRQMAAVKRAKDGASRAYRQAGFDAAWAVSLDKFRIQDLIYRLQTKLDKLKASLKTEQDAGKADQGALQQLQNWQTGGLQGTNSIADSLESTIYNMLDLYRQGASLPTSDRNSPTLKILEDVLTGTPPDGLGLTLPPGLTQGIAQASKAYADFTAFQASRQALFTQFGSNFLPAGVSPSTNSANIGAGMQFFGAGAGSSGGTGAPAGFASGGYLGIRDTPGRGGTTVNITNNFASGPPDPHTWSAGTSHELNAMV